MDCSKIGELIFQLRHEKKMTQKQLADKMNISGKTISKWERGLGCPDVSLLTQLSNIFGVNIQDILSGDLPLNDFVGGNMKKSRYFVCPECSNIVIATGNAEISCCGRKLDALEAVKAVEKLNVEKIENDWYVTTEHPMKKEHYISFIAFAEGDKIQIIKQYPEWNLQSRILGARHGALLWYCTGHGLFYQNI